MTSRRGIALVSILIVAATLLVFISVGLKMGSSGVLFVSQVHKRNVALGAAEAGVFEAMLRLQQNKHFTGNFQGTLTDSQGTYQVSVDNQLFGNRVARVTSTGEYGRVKRTIRAELEPDSAGMQALTLDGKVYVFDRAYVNAIASPSSPVARPGHAYTAYQSGGAHSYVGREFHSSGSNPLLHATGELSTRGNFDPDLERVSMVELTNTVKQQYRLDPVQMASGSFATATTLGPGVLAGSTEVNADVEVHGKVIVPKGTTLVINGDARFLGGLGGEGQVVVNGDALVRTDATFDPSIEEGIKLYVDQSLLITHPQTAVEDGEVQNAVFHEVGDYFAKMPIEASTDLSVALPVSAPRGTEFFSWFDQSVGSPDSEFSLWYNGDGTDIYPGLTEETKQWLNDSRSLLPQLESWGGGP